MASGRIRQIAHPITSLRWPGVSNNHHNEKFDNPYWEQKLSEGKFLLRNPLRDRPDWTYLDGRPSPLNETQLALKLEQVELAKEIVQGLKEIKQAEAEHQSFMKKEKEMIQAMQLAKPKAKGVNHPRVRSGR